MQRTGRTWTAHERADCPPQGSLLESQIVLDLIKSLWDDSVGRPPLSSSAVTSLAAKVNRWHRFPGACPVVPHLCPVGELPYSSPSQTPACLSQPVQVTLAHKAPTPTPPCLASPICCHRPLQSKPNWSEPGGGCHPRWTGLWMRVCVAGCVH